MGRRRTMTFAAASTVPCTWCTAEMGEMKTGLLEHSQRICALKGGSFHFVLSTDVVSPILIIQ
jgi:hypothetical protein